MIKIKNLQQSLQRYNRHKPMLFIMILMLLVSCNQKKEANKTHAQNNLLKHYHKGKLQAEFTLKNGVREGIGKYYYENGKLSSVCNYKNGLREGIEYKYYYDGSLYRTREFSKGELNGVEKRFYRNGQLKTLLDYKHGMPGTGLKEYFISGELKTKYPEFLHKIVYDRDYPEEKLLVFYFSDHHKNVSYYQGPLIEGKYFNTKASPCCNNNGIGEIALNPGFSGEIVVSAKYITPYRAPYIVEKRITIK